MLQLGELCHSYKLILSSTWGSSSQVNGTTTVQTSKYGRKDPRLLMMGPGEIRRL